MNDLKVSLAQMPVEPGRPDRNANYIIEEIQYASARGSHLVIFPELATTGYIIADRFEDPYFIEDVSRLNRKIVESTRGLPITAIFGTVTVDQNAKGEDGRVRKHNGAIVARDGKTLGPFFGGTIKSLQPNYRFFNDAKHFFSMRALAEERDVHLRNLLPIIPLQTPLGTIRLGVILCEDMWHADYALNPTKILVAKGAELIVNLSASPWTWQKTRKRHMIVERLLKESPVPFIYVNNTGAQQTGKNVIVFDGCSTVYNRNGEVVFEISPYVAETRDFTFTPTMARVPDQVPNDTEELYGAMVAATKSITPLKAPIVIGLSGGIDSAVSAALMTDVFGPARVHAINMPFKDLNSDTIKGYARAIAENLGISYEVAPIENIVNAIAATRSIVPGTITYENVQARAREEVLAAEAQKLGGVFTCNTNKVEMAFGYGTLYGDVAGYFAPLGDLVKREVRQIAEYLNKKFGRLIIPDACINQIPTAELSANQKDPFDYGDTLRRGYHDEMVRAFTDFRKNAEWFLELYIKGTLEAELKLDAGTLKRLFPTSADFVTDLERQVRNFHRGFFKRIQCPPVPIYSRRAFGRDLEETLAPPHFTAQYLYLRDRVLPQLMGRTRIAVYGGSFNPPGLHHSAIIECLSKSFEKVLVVPCGERHDKKTTANVSLLHRKAMAKEAFAKINNVTLDFTDLDADTFTPTITLAERASTQFPTAELWFVIGGDLVANGRDQQSPIQTTWVRGKEVWDNLNFAVLNTTGSPIALADLPKKSRVIDLPITFGRSTLIREYIAAGTSIADLVTTEVAQYIEANKLYR